MTLKKLLLALVISRLIIALFLVYVGASGAEKQDSVGYVGLANSLWHGSFSAPGVPETLRGPGYPILLMLAVATKYVVTLALIENIVVAAFAGWMVWLTTGTLFPGSSARSWALLLYCCEPIGLFYAGAILAETLFAAVLLVCIWLLIRFYQEGSVRFAALAAAALAGATYVRSVSLYLGILVPLLLAMRRRVTAAVTFALVFVGLLVPWVVRNAVELDYPSFSSLGTYNLFFAASAGIEAVLSGRSLSDVEEDWGFTNEAKYFKHHPEQIGWTPGKVYSSMMTEARNNIVHHPILYAAIHLKGCAIVLLDPGRLNLSALGLYPKSGLHFADIWRLSTLKSYPFGLPVLLALGFQLLAYYWAAAKGVRFLPQPVAVLFVAVVIYFVIVSGMPVAQPRYRVPFMPLICMAAAPVLARYADETVSVPTPQAAAAV